MYSIIMHCYGLRVLGLIDTRVKCAWISITIVHNVFRSHEYENLYRMTPQRVLPVYDHHGGNNYYQRQKDTNSEYCNWNVW